MHYETYVIKGRKYRYQVMNYRQGNKVKHKKTYLGPVDPVNKNKRKKGGGRKPELFVRQAAIEEQAELNKATKSNNAFTRDRAKIVLLSSQNIPVNAIAGKISCDLRKVRAAIKGFNSKGLAALQRGKAKGATPKFTDPVKRIILMHFSCKPGKFNYHFTAWTLPRFRKHLMDFSIVASISVERLRQILDEAGAKLKRSKRWQYSPDKEFHKKNLQ
mgnify:CR=1 FL=1